MRARGSAGRALTRGVGLIGGQAATWALALIWIAIVPRAIGPATFGRYVFLASVLTVASALGAIGLDVHVARAVARRDGDDVVSNAIAAGAIGVVAATASAALIAGRETPLVAMLLALGFAAQGIGNLSFAILQGHERPGARAALDVVAKAVFTVGSVWAVDQDAGLEGIAAAWAAGYGAYALAGFVVVRARGWAPRARAARAGMIEVVRDSAPMGLHLAAQTVYYRADAAILAPVRGARAAGAYGAAFRLFDTLSYVTSLYAFLVSPRLIRMARAAPAEARTLYARSAAAMGALGVCATAGVQVLGPWMIRTLFGAQFANAVTPLRVLGVGLIFAFLATPAAWMLVAHDAQRSLARTSVIAAIFNVAANLVAIPLAGAAGAAATTVATEVVVWALLTRAVTRLPPAGESSGRPVAGIDEDAPRPQ